MSQKRESISRTIGRSSLGAPAVRKLRARTSVQQRSQILRKAASKARVSSVGRTKR